MSGGMDIIAIIIENTLNKCQEINGGCDKCELDCIWREREGE